MIDDHFIKHHHQMQEIFAFDGVILQSDHQSPEFYIYDIHKVYLALHQITIEI